MEVFIHFHGPGVDEKRTSINTPAFRQDNQGRRNKFKVVFHSKFQIFAIFLNIHKASPNTDHNIICMFLKRKTISKPEKSSLSYTNQGKTTILSRANNGIQLVYSTVCNFNGIVLFNYSNICVNFKVDYLEECLTDLQKFS